MNKEWEKVKEFHKKFGHPVSNTPIKLEKERATKRYKWMLEEINEFIEAEDIVEQADAMIDVMYFALGTLVEMGISPDYLFDIVHKANMSKLWKDGLPHYNLEGKTIKPNDWEDPHNKLEAAISMQRYTKDLVIAKPNYCVPASMLMVLQHYGIYELTQDNIADSLSITPINENIDHGLWGAHVDNNTLNNFFDKNCIGLTETFVSINSFMDEYFMSDKIEELLSNDVSIICGYNYMYLFGKREDTFGHVSIIFDISDDKRIISIIDPGPKNAGVKRVDASELFYAIKARNDGLWCIKRK